MKSSINWLCLFILILVASDWITRLRVERLEDQVKELQQLIHKEQPHAPQGKKPNVS